MKFHIRHNTHYHYAQPASESFAELRVMPQDDTGQRVLSSNVSILPQTQCDMYMDYFGNKVIYFSLPHRHNELRVEAISHVETQESLEPTLSLDVPVGEALQIFNSQMLDLFDFLQPTAHVPLYSVLKPIRKQFFRHSHTLRACLHDLTHWIFESFHYTPGATTVETPLAQVINQRRGVCQDFAHLMLSILRSSGIPARYVSGYIEAVDPDSGASLEGAAASHAWVEVFLPGNVWYGLDPTNNQPVGARHVKVAVGRDYRDAAPLRGTFKGASSHELRVMVNMERKGKRSQASPTVKSRKA